MSDTPAPGGTGGMDRDGLLERLLPEGRTVLLKNRAGQAAAMELSLCRGDRFGDIMALQNTVYGQIADKETFVLLTPEELTESLELDFCIGAFAGGRLAAFTLMVANRPGRRNLGCAGAEPMEAAGCVTYDSTFVDPGWAGYGLQRFFVTLKDKLALALGARAAFATVSPLNAVSLNNMLASGFRIVEEKNMYGGYDRYLLCKPLADTGRRCAPSEGPTAGETGGPR